ncbi:hypothetical protein ACET3X_001933 [Alternaria dauci]|uniref:Uncharacterized protein n=1 Tax=Alternaria dauci TaxID=48095 RepID=A0ABR3V0U7_9PLEO
MLGPALPILTFVALAQARAIVTNHCSYNVYVWSVPQVLSSSHTDNVPLKPGGQYQEPWRHGSIVNPGVAIKISTKSDGILNFADEIDFAYAVDGNDDSKIWVNLSPVRGDAFKDNLAFHSCNAQYDSASVQTHQCTATDDVELVLCDTSPRSTPEKDPTPLEQVKACYNYHHVLPEAQEGDLQVATDTDSDSDTDYEEESDGLTLKFTYTMAFTGEYTAPPASEAAAESSVAKPTDDSSVPSTSSGQVHTLPIETFSSTKDASTTSSASSLRLFTPPYDVRTDCSECDKALVLSPCLSRVVYPARRRAAAVPRSTPDKFTPQHRANLALCDVVRKYHPGIGACDESKMESYARTIFPKICDPQYATLLMGFPCEEIKEELKELYPAIDAPKAPRAPLCQCISDPETCKDFINVTGDCQPIDTDQDILPSPNDLEPSLVEPESYKICLWALCDPILDGVSCDDIKDVLTSSLTSLGERYEDWVSEESNDDCEEFNVIDDNNDNYGVCMAELCDLYSEKCDLIQSTLASATKAKFGVDVAFMTDYDECIQWLLDHDDSKY